MAVKYDKLFHLLIDRKITNAQLAQKAGVSANIIARLKRDQYISMESIERLCVALNCGVDDILEFICPNGKNLKVKLDKLIDSLTNKEYREINSGLDKVISIPFEWILNDKNNSKSITKLTVLRKKKNISEIDQARINLDKEAYKIELGYDNSIDKYNELADNLKKLTENI